MEQAEARNILRTLHRELSEAQAVASAALRRAASLEKLVSGYLELFPDLANDPGTAIDGPLSEAEKPKGQDAVIRVLEDFEFKGRYWTVAAMVDEMSRRGWLPDSKGNPANAVRTALTRAQESNPARIRKGTGSTGALVYYYQPEGAPPPHFYGDDDRQQLPGPWIPDEVSASA